MLSCGSACDFLLPWGCSILEPFCINKGNCTCSQLSSMSVTCCSKFISMNTLQSCFSNFIAVFSYACRCSVSVLQLLQQQKEVYCRPYSKSIVCIAVAFLSILQCTYYFSIILGDLATVIETKKESGLNQSKVNSFVGRLAQNNS